METLWRFMKAYLAYGAAVSCLMKLAFVMSAGFIDMIKDFRKCKTWTDRIIHVLAIIISMAVIGALSIALFTSIGWAFSNAFPWIKSLMR